MDTSGKCPSGSERSHVGPRIAVALLRRRCDESTAVAIDAATQQQARACVSAREFERSRVPSGALGRAQSGVER